MTWVGLQWRRGSTRSTRGGDPRRAPELGRREDLLGDVEVPLVCVEQRRGLGSVIGHVVRDGRVLHRAEGAELGVVSTW